MDILSNIYSKSLSENERNLRFWEDYLKSLNDLDFKVFSDKLTVPVMVPIGSRILFRGELKHTNEVTVAIGSDYFAKCSIAQAEILRQHRIKDAKSKIDMFTKGKEYLENQQSFRKDSLFEDGGQEIVEVYSEEEDRAWRKKHRENVRQYKIKSKTEVENKEEITDEELWNRLEELELQEELENELRHTTESPLEKKKLSDFVIKEEDAISPVTHKEIIYEDLNVDVHDKEVKKKEVQVNSKPKQISKLDLLQKVIDRQNELDEKLQELKQKERARSNTESDLMARLDEMEQLDELEDEMDRLEDIIEGEDDNSEESQETDIDSEKEEESTQSSSSVIQRKVSFADQDDSETLEIVFKHSDVPPIKEAYDPNKGIQKPSDIYSAFPHMFKETTSILKKTKYLDEKDSENSNKKQGPPKVTFMQTEEDDEYENKTIVVRDVVERTDQNGNSLENTEARPTSLFKKKRMQNKS